MERGVEEEQAETQVANVSEERVADAQAGTATSPAASIAAAEGAAPALDARKIHEEVELPDEEMLYDLADLFKVFADTTRIRILYALMVEDLSVNDIAEAVGGVSQSAVSHQLRILKQAHLVKFRREGKQMIYSLSDDHVYTMLSQGLTHICE